MRRYALLAALALFVDVARADPPPRGSYVTLAVPVGGTVSLDAGFARGLLCDNLVILRAELRGETPFSNRLFVTGVRPGETLCRVGTARGTPTFFWVHAVVTP